MFVKERIYKTWGMFGITIFNYGYDVYQFVPLTKLSKINNEQKQIEIGDGIKKGIAENTEKYDREVRLTA